MSDNFTNSIAQSNVQFPIETVIEPIAGENYSRALIYMPLSKASDYLPGVSDAAAGTITVLNASNFGSVTGALLRNWLIPFFASAQSGIIGVAIYDDTDEASTNLLPEVYEKTKYYAYFKFGITDTTGYNDLQAALCNLVAADVLYSRLWVGTSDTNVLSKTSTLVTALKATSGTYHMIFSTDATVNPALAQLGKSLSTVNVTGTPVGNDIDMVGFNTVKASGLNGANLDPTQKLALDDQKISYLTAIGDGTENVCTEGSLYNNGDSVGAEWVKAYITYMAKIKTANYMTQMNKFRNNDTYQGIILILADIVNKFVTLGRLDNFVITAPVFRDLPQSGDVITVPNAWSAYYIDKVRQVSVFGKLYITMPTR